MRRKARAVVRRVSRASGVMVVKGMWVGVSGRKLLRKEESASGKSAVGAGTATDVDADGGGGGDGK